MRSHGELASKDWKSSESSKNYRPLIRKAERFLEKLDEDWDIDDEEYNTKIAEELYFLVEALKESILLENIKRADELKKDIIEILEDE
jgi:hypothetical protein